MNNRKGQIALGALIILFMGIIVAVAMLPSISDNTNVITDKQNVVDEVVSVANAKSVGQDFNVSVDLGPIVQVPEGWNIANCPLSAITVTNASGTALTVTTDYTLSTTTGVLNMKNTTATVDAFIGNNNSLIDYTYCADGYGADSGTRGVTKLILIGATLGLLGFAAFYVYKGLKIK